ncbi:MAG: hypothetical protein NTX45_05735 [Proteobacteria bacterium]|nr:hypothetical protein [Pseudomonadota bacterium]
MAENIEYLILEQFRAMRNQIEGMQTEMRNEFSDVKHRINRLESAVAGYFLVSTRRVVTRKNGEVEGSEEEEQNGDGADS